jgi:hypothetical protein
MLHPARFVLCALSLAVFPIGATSWAQVGDVTREPQAAATEAARTEAAGVGSLPVQSQAENRKPQATLEFYAGHAFESDFSDQPGSMSVSRAGVDFSALFPVTETGSIGFGLNADQSWYDFSDFSLASPALAISPTSQPWDDIRSVAATISWFSKINEEWSYFVSGQVQSSGEEGANFEDTLTYGGALAFTYQASESLAIGVGIAATTRLEESAFVIPIPSLRWQIDPKWLLASDLDHDGVGLKLSYDICETLTIALKGGYFTRDFRLSDDNPAREGVGRHSGIPVRVSLDWNFAPQGTLWVAGGYIFGQELELNIQSGDEIVTLDVDASPMISGGLSFRF